MERKQITTQFSVDLKMKKSCNVKPAPYMNLSNEEGKTVFKNFLEHAEFEKMLKNGLKSDLHHEYDMFMELWNEGVVKSFKKVYPRTTSMTGLSTEIKDLMKEERVG